MLLTSLLYDMMSESTGCALNEWCILILVKTAPTREESRVRIRWTRMAPPASELRSLAVPGFPEEREGQQVLRPLPVQDWLPMFFLKSKCLCCQERVCLSPGDSGCQA